MKPIKTYRYLALGDSYTIGESVTPDQRFPNILANELNKKGLHMETPTIFAQTGWTTGNLKSAIKNASLISGTFQLVSLLIGVNNQYQGRSQQEYKKEFIELTTTAISLAGGVKSHFVIVSIPDYGYTPFGKSSQEEISTAIAAFNVINKAVADSLGVSYINITPISQKGLDQPDLVAFDNLHPSAKMYQAWVDLMLPTVERLLQ